MHKFAHTHHIALVGAATLLLPTQARAQEAKRPPPPAPSSYTPTPPANRPVISPNPQPRQSYASAARTGVYGRLVGNGYYGPTSVPGVMVTLYNPRLGRCARAISRPDGTFYFGNIPLGAYFVEVWYPNTAWPHRFQILVNRLPVVNVGTLQVGAWLQAGFQGV
jgi:hypothetical protein